MKGKYKQVWIRLQQIVKKLRCVFPPFFQGKTMERKKVAETIFFLIFIEGKNERLEI